jgi:hypothetical protein
MPTNISNEVRNVKRGRQRKYFTEEEIKSALSEKYARYRSSKNGRQRVLEYREKHKEQLNNNMKLRYLFIKLGKLYDAIQL